MIDDVKFVWKECWGQLCPNCKEAIDMQGVRVHVCDVDSKGQLREIPGIEVALPQSMAGSPFSLLALRMDRRNNNLLLLDQEPRGRQLLKWATSDAIAVIHTTAIRTHGGKGRHRALLIVGKLRVDSSSMVGLNLRIETSPFLSQTGDTTIAYENRRGQIEMFPRFTLLGECRGWLDGSHFIRRAA